MLKLNLAPEHVYFNLSPFQPQRLFFGRSHDPASCLGLDITAIAKLHPLRSHLARQAPQPLRVSPPPLNIHIHTDVILQYPRVGPRRHCV